jgi:hypothetical protein
VTRKNLRTAQARGLCGVSPTARRFGEPREQPTDCDKQLLGHLVLKDATIRPRFQTHNPGQRRIQFRKHDHARGGQYVVQSQPYRSLRCLHRVQLRRVRQGFPLELVLGDRSDRKPQLTNEPRPTTPPAGCPTVRGFPNRGSSDPSESALTPTGDRRDTSHLASIK